MRGTHPRKHARRLEDGIIPAYAGNTFPDRPWSCRAEDHPRVCGEHILMALSYRASRGSSPRMRGTRDHGEIGERDGGIIPAYAGNTATVRRLRSVFGDHPRVCGEHRMMVFFAISTKGSSPRMRGTPMTRAGSTAKTGIIPAYAGNTPRPHGTCPATRDHPRVCGEHFPHLMLSFRREGSSPRMRGTHGQLSVHIPACGIIPAYAGNTVSHSRTRNATRDHPRVCGEHNNVCHCNSSARGSSPRMRGTRQSVC